MSDISSKLSNRVLVGVPLCNHFKPTSDLRN
jgi:hypothetical protein